jgi:hypothetical protein
MARMDHKRQSIGSFPSSTRAAFVREKLLDPINGAFVLVAESGEGCAHWMTLCFARLMLLHFSFVKG